MASYEVQTEGGTYQVDTDDETPWSDVPGNAAKDIGGMATSGLKMFKDIVDPVNIIESGFSGSLDPTKKYLSDSYQQLKGMPKALYNEAKQTVTHPIETFKQHPLNTALNVAGAAGLAGEGLGLLGKAGEAGTAAEMAGVESPLAETLKSAPSQVPSSSGLRSAIKLRGKTYIGDPGEIHADVINKMATELGESPDTVIDAVNKIGDQGFTQNGNFLTRDEVRSMTGSRPEAASLLGEGKMDTGLNTDIPKVDPMQAVKDHLESQYGPKAQEVKDYISRGYEGFAKKPGNISNVADYVQSKSQMMALQQMGFTPGQIRNLGKTPMEIHAAERAIGQYGLDSGIVSPANGLKGMVEKNHALLESTGKKIDSLRKAADSVGPAYQPGELLKAVQEKLDPIYKRGVTAESPIPRGVKSSDHSAYQKALEEVEDVSPTHLNAADVATKLNHEATMANKMSQNPGPYTDVANAVSEINNERVKAKLNPEAIKQYEQALREYGVNKKISNGLKYKTGGEVKRFGPGSIGSNLVQKGMDEFGYKVGAKAANKLSTFILKNPSLGKSLPSLFKEFINHVEETGEDFKP